MAVGETYDQLDKRLGNSSGFPNQMTVERPQRFDRPAQFRRWCPFDVADRCVIQALPPAARMRPLSIVVNPTPSVGIYSLQLPVDAAKGGVSIVRSAVVAT